MADEFQKLPVEIIGREGQFIGRSKLRLDAVIEHETPLEAALS